MLLLPTGATTPTAPHPSPPAQAPQLPQSPPRLAPDTGPLPLLLRPQLLQLPPVPGLPTNRKFYLQMGDQTNPKTLTLSPRSSPVSPATYTGAASANAGSFALAGLVAAAAVVMA